MRKFTNRCVSKFAIAVVISGVFLAHAGYADTPIDPTVQKPDSMARHEGGMQRVDDRIKELHDTLNITPDEEPAWKKVTRIMRQNEASIRKLVEARHQNESANAIDDLNSYESIARAHEDGLKRLIPAFKAFYNSLTPEQKTKADDMFGRYEGRKDDPAAAPVDNTNMAPPPADNNAAAAPPPPQPPAPPPPAPAPGNSN